MARPKLVIVESPSKAKTIHKYLGDGYVVESSKGHLIDLPKSRLAVDIENGFKPEYKVVHGRSKDLKRLKAKAAAAEEVLLAADPDREGEAISWHLYNAFKDVNPNIRRVVFNEITADVVREAVKHPGTIDESLVNAQQARRIMDRLVGYQLSPLLWKKVKSGLSAGRVQSVALRIVCEREDEIERFVPQEYWEVEVEVGLDGSVFPARLVRVGETKVERIGSQEEAERILALLRSSEITVASVTERTVKRKPLAPYTTSKLQQDGVNRLGLTAKRTMQIAQELYEGVEIPGEGATGLITYMRTDSTRVSPQAVEAARRHIREVFGPEYLPAEPPVYEKGKASQDAHEAIRPTSVDRTPESLKGCLERSAYRLYKMIWDRFVASQMAEAEYRNIQVRLSAGECELAVSGSRPVFPGYTKVFAPEGKTDTVPGIERLKEGDRLRLVRAEAVRKLTSPPPRFTDATLVKTLEESGIGRPSTYAPTIATLLARHYVVRQDRQLVPTPLGRKVNELLVAHFPDIVDMKFTATLERELDEIAEDRKPWVDVVRDFYLPFAADLQRAHETIGKVEMKLEEPTPFTCEKCGKLMVKKFGRYGHFLACSGFPECRNIRPVPLGKCPRPGCEGDVVRKRGRKGRFFYGCSAYPACDFTTFHEVLEEPCPKCGRILVRVKEAGKVWKRCLNESCGHQEEGNA